jgi:exonuclease III
LETWEPFLRGYLKEVERQERLNNRRRHLIIAGDLNVVSDPNNFQVAHDWIKDAKVKPDDQGGNLPEERTAHLSLRREVGLVDAHEGQGPYCYTYGRMATNRHKMKLDYVLVSEAARPCIKRTGIYQTSAKPLSDHDAVYAFFDWENTQEVAHTDGI